MYQPLKVLNVRTVSKDLLTSAFHQGFARLKEYAL